MEARELVAVLMADLAWLSGAADQAGVSVPDRVVSNVQAAVAFLGTPEPDEEPEADES